MNPVGNIFSQLYDKFLRPKEEKKTEPKKDEEPTWASSHKPEISPTPN